MRCRNPAGKAQITVTGLTPGPITQCKCAPSAGAPVIRIGRSHVAYVRVNKKFPIEAEPAAAFGRRPLFILRDTGIRLFIFLLAVGRKNRPAYWCRYLVSSRGANRVSFLFIVRIDLTFLFPASTSTTVAESTILSPVNPPSWSFPGVSLYHVKR